MHDILRAVRWRIRSILGKPSAWGPMDTIDLQVILLVETGRIAAGLSSEGVYDRWVSLALSPENAKDFLGGPRTSMYARTLRTPGTMLPPEVYNVRFIEALRAFVEAELPGDLGMIVQAAGESEDPG
jgi:hypothetical protein